MPKGDAFVTAQLAGIMAAKQTAALIPLAHPLPLANIEVRFEWTADGELRVEAQARTIAPTGVEMEAMVAATVAALTIYDMTKAVDKGITIESVRLLEKSGGKSGPGRVTFTAALIVLSDRVGAASVPTVAFRHEGKARERLRSRSRDGPAGRLERAAGRVDRYRRRRCRRSDSY